MYGHLVSEAVEALTLPTQERIKFVQEDRWVGYTSAKRIMQQLDDLFVYPKSLRMPNILLVGRSDNGKSSIIEHFVSRHPRLMRDDGTSGPCTIWLSMPAAPTESNFWSAVLWSMGIAHRERDTPDKKRRQAFEVMEFVSVRMIAIDEFNHLTNAGKDAARLLAAIKNVSSALKVPILAAGTQAAINALNSDPQMKSRFTPAVLDRWKLDREYLRLLSSMETFLPLPEPSNLASREIAPVVYGMAGDTIGGTVRLLQNAAAYAIRAGKPRIDAELLASVKHVRPGQWDEVAQRV
jgi:hypothetical protein